jgi:hypothetical protein
VNAAEGHLCSICSAERLPEEDWFLVTQSRWEDKVRVFEWNDQLARKSGIHAACSPIHVREAVVHWMTTGSLDYPFANAVFLSTDDVRRRGRILPELRSDEFAGVRQIGELAVHRESLGRALAENPQSLNVILDELLIAVRSEWQSTPNSRGEGNRIFCMSTRTV